MQKLLTWSAAAAAATWSAATSTGTRYGYEVRVRGHITAPES
jgi:hypothetical protein